MRCFRLDPQLELVNRKNPGLNGAKGERRLGGGSAHLSFIIVVTRAKFTSEHGSAVHCELQGQYGTADVRDGRTWIKTNQQSIF